MEIAEDFKTLDGVWMAELKGREIAGSALRTSVKSVCPAVEFIFGRAGGGLHETSNAIDPATLGLLEPAIKGQALEQVNGGANPQSIEWTRLPARGAEYVNQNEWVGFCLRFDKSAQQAGCSFDQAKTLVAAMRELTSNVHEHSGASHSILVVYQAQPGFFAFSVADAGIGVLASLKSNAVYANLPDAESALRALLQGASRYGSGHGNGYKEVFRVLEKCAGFVRCRSGDAVLSFQTGSRPLIVQRPRFPGLVVSVVAHK